MTPLLFTREISYAVYGILRTALIPTTSKETLKIISCTELSSPYERIQNYIIVLCLCLNARDGKPFCTLLGSNCSTIKLLKIERSLQNYKFN